MITARRSRWFERIFRPYNRNLIARRFEGLRVAGLEHLRDARAGVPLVLYANHSSWWDGLVAFEIGVGRGLEQYVMMEERQLGQYPLFRRLGAFSVEKGNPRAAAQSVEYAAALLRGDEKKRFGTNERHEAEANAKAALWIFPQGRLLPNDARPLRFYAGAAHIVRRLNAVALLPIAMRYEHLDDFRPEIFVRVGAPRYVERGNESNVKALTRCMEAELTATLDRVRADVAANNFVGYEELVAPTRRRAKQL